jgi:NAD-dependent dihydropyrimidine dehydrogenase PreA subunit
MAAKKITVVISQSQGKNPAMRQLEEDLAARLIMEPGVDVSIVPNLYDMHSDHTGLLFLRSVTGPMVVLGWLYPRAIRWTLDRQGVRGHEGVSLLTADDEEDESSEPEARNGIGSVDVPNRKLYCIDLRARPKAEPYVEEVRRIARENAQETVQLVGWVGGPPVVVTPTSSPATSPRAAVNGNGATTAPVAAMAATSVAAAAPAVIDEPVKRRWYPVIDYSKCTNCMECIDFCLFGVYGLDSLSRILVESQDNCKKGCPACSRVCPENAIIFPQHKSAAIAGAEGEIAGLKIDLSKLFGGEGKDALEVAVQERDAELLKDGREAVGMAVGIPRRQADKTPRQRDALDDLMDGLDKLDF